MVDSRTKRNGQLLGDNFGPFLGGFSPCIPGQIEILDSFKFINSVFFECLIDFFLAQSIKICKC